MRGWLGRGDSDEPDSGPYGPGSMIGDVQFDRVRVSPDVRHVDVAILYGLGQKDRAQHVARQLRPKPVSLPEGFEE